jgi:predicted DNA-binding ribbon-helix-helix protein
MLAGHKTSVSLEDAFWQGLKEIASRRKMSGSALIGQVDAQRGDGNLSSAIRLFVLDYFRTLAEPQLAGNNHEDEKAAREAGVIAPTYRETGTRPLGLRRWA